MTKGGTVLRALSPKRQRTASRAAAAGAAAAAESSSPASPTGRQGSRTLFSRKRPRDKELPDLDKTDEEFEREWGITKAVEERKLVEFRRAVEAAVGPLHPFYDNYYLRRFLRARSHDIPKAKEMFLKHLQWRKENGVDTILEDFVFEERDAFLTLWPQGYHKTDKLGRPIYIQHLGQINVKALTELTTEERMIKFHVQEYERALKYIFPACSKVAARHTSQTLTILDVQGVGLRHLTGEVKRIMGLITRVDQDNYPETLGKTLIINAPSIFKMVWSLVKPMLDVRTQAKIEVCPSNFLPTLLRWADAENIPEYLGGKSKGSLLDDVGPWKDPKLVAEIDADIWRRDHGTMEHEADNVSSLGSPRGAAEPMAAESPEPQHEGVDRLTSDSEGGEEFHDVRSRRDSMISSAGSLTAYLSAEEEFYTPKGPEVPGAEGTPSSFSSDRPLSRHSTGGGVAAAAAQQQLQQQVAARGGAGPTGAGQFRSPERRPSPLRIPDGEGDVTPSTASLSAHQGPFANVPLHAPAAAAAAAPAAAAAAAMHRGSVGSATHKGHVGAEDLIPSPPLQIPILARVRALEEKIPAVERPIRRYLPPSEVPSKVVGEGTLLSRVAALERAMEALLTAQDCALNEAKRRAEQQQSSRTCCGCCSIM